MPAVEKSEPASDSTAMAVDRTLMAADRSLMAWVRTGLSLISFGFTIFKFLQYAGEQLVAAGKLLGTPSGPRVVGLFMIGTGILCLVFGIAEHVAIIRSLRGRFDIRRPRYSLWMALIITISGLVLFIGMILRIRGIG